MQVAIVYSRFEFALLNLCFPSWKLTNRLVLVPEPNGPGVKYEQDLHTRRLGMDTSATVLWSFGRNDMA